MPKITFKKTWEGRESIGKIESVIFSDIFHRYLDISENKTCFEVGCVPGRFLVYICKNFKYTAEGIDYIDNTKKIVEKSLEENGIKKNHIYEGDFLEWSTEKRYDLLCSFGFIEHFTGQTNSTVIEKHVELTKSGGKIILEVPNFRNLQYFFHFLLDRDNLKEHNLETMKLSYYKAIAKKFNLRILHLDYCGGFFEYWGISNNANIFQKVLYKFIKIFERIINRNKTISQINNRFLSPYVMFVAEKL